MLITGDCRVTGTNKIYKMLKKSNSFGLYQIRHLFLLGVASHGRGHRRGASPEVPQTSIALFVQLLQRDIPQLATSFGAKKKMPFLLVGNVKSPL
jgi:hypothetical protein